MPDIEPILRKFLVTVPAALAVLAGAVVLNLVVRRGLHLLAAKTSFAPRDLLPFQKLGRWLINAGALVLLLGVFGFNLSGIWAMLATLLGMVAIGFVAVWSVLSNTLCTLLILVYRPFEVGDEIEIAGEEVRGRVIDLNFIYTTLRAADGGLVQIPNNFFLQRVVKRHPGSIGVSLAEQLTASHPAVPGVPEGAASPQSSMTPITAQLPRKPA
jgi:small-conductance mechanosensitive channel